MRKINLEELLKSGVHFGHRETRWHPKMRPYIYTVKSGIHLINLEKTKEKLQAAMNFAKEISAKNGIILFLATKRQAKDIIRKYAEDLSMPHVTERWIGGTITNFETVRKLIDKFTKMKESQKTGELKKYTKKEQLKFDEQIKKQERLVGGIANLKKLPDAIFIIDAKQEKTALREAMKKNIPVIALVDTNTDPTGIQYPIPANDDAIKSIDIITGFIAEAIKEGKKVSKEPKKDN